MQKKIVVVGGGIVGCIISLYLKKAGNQVILFEQKNKLGGVLNDQKFENDLFFNGTQYFDANEEWFKVIQKLIPEFCIFEHNYASYTNLNLLRIFSNNYAVPIFDMKISEIKLKKKKFFLSLKDRIKVYPQKISRLLSMFLNQSNLDIKIISEICSDNLNISRVGLKKNNGLANLKSNNVFFDKFFAINRNKLFKKKLKYALPVCGYDIFFEKLKKKLEELGIEIYTNCKIHPLWNSKKFEIYVNNKKIENDYIFWSGNPTPLIKEFNHAKLDSYVFRTLQINANLKEKNIKEKFIQIYSKNSKIFRVNLYQINKISKISIECFYNKLSPNFLLKQAKDMLKPFKLNLNYENKSIYKAFLNRFDIFTIKDKKTIENFIESTNKTNLLSSPWTIYGRTQKINKILVNLKNKKLI